MLFVAFYFFLLINSAPTIIASAITAVSAIYSIGMVEFVTQKNLPPKKAGVQLSVWMVVDS